MKAYARGENFRTVGSYETLPAMVYFAGDLIHRKNFDKFPDILGVDIGDCMFRNSLYGSIQTSADLSPTESDTSTEPNQGPAAD